MNIAIPVLDTDRLLLSSFGQEDIDDIYAYASDPEVAAMVTWDAHRSLEDSQAFLQFIRSFTNCDPLKYAAVWAIRRRADGVAIGSIQFTRASSMKGQIDYALGRQFWRQGITTEAARAVIDWAFRTFPELERIQAFALPENTGSIGVIKKAGMLFEGVNRSALRSKGRVVDLAVCAITRSDL